TGQGIQRVSVPAPEHLAVLEDASPNIQRKLLEDVHVKGVLSVGEFLAGKSQRAILLRLEHQTYVYIGGRSVFPTCHTPEEQHGENVRICFWVRQQFLQGTRHRHGNGLCSLN